MKKIFIYGIVIASAITVGVGGGILAKRVFGSVELDYGNMDVNTLKADSKAIYNKVSTSKGDISKTCSAVEIANYSIEKFRRCENCVYYQYGVADAGIVLQDIRSCSIKNGNNYFEESVSKSSMVAVGSRMFQEGEKSDVMLYHASSGSVNITSEHTVATYTENNKQHFTADDYIKAYGKTLDEMFIYAVSEKTVNSSSIEKSGSEYILNFDLNPDLATYFYKLQMKSISNLDKLPNFSSVNLKFRLSEDFTIKQLSIDENYVATMMVDAKTHGTIETYFFADEYIKIPSLNDEVQYKKGN